MRLTVLTAVAVSAIAQIIFPRPTSSGPTRIVSVTILAPDFGDVKNIYGWVTAAQLDRTTIGLQCHTSSEWVYQDPCRGAPAAKVVVAPPGSSTAEMTLTRYDSVEHVDTAITIGCTFKPNEATCSATATFTSTPWAVSSSSYTTIISGSEVSNVWVVPVTITQGVERLGPEPTQAGQHAGGQLPTGGEPTGQTGGAASTTSTSNPGVPAVTARALLAGVAAAVVAL